MRELIWVVTMGSIACHLTAIAQTPETSGQSSTPDFSGIYDASSVPIGSSVLSEPDLYPLTDEGDLALSAYDRVEADRQNTDDCAPETMPSERFTWSPEAEIRAWNCISFGDRHEEPDIDELARMLEAL